MALETTSTFPTAIIADDESIVRRLIRLLLMDMQCNVIDEASNGKDAISKYDMLRPDLMFIDINMPDIDGLSVLEAILGINKNAFAVIVSANSTADNVRQAIQSGAQGFIVKPFTPKKFHDIINKYHTQHTNAGGLEK
jgi:two-component system, chemotaxis family, chemotaxis protein CheY